MHPAFCDQPERTGFRDIVAEIDFHIVVTRHALVLTAAKCIEVPAVQRADDVCYVLTIVVGRAGNFLRRRRSSDGQPCGWDHETFIYVDVRSDGMVHDQKSKVVVVVRFPKFRGNSQIVEPVVRN